MIASYSVKYRHSSVPGGGASCRRCTYRLDRRTEPPSTQVFTLRRGAPSHTSWGWLRGGRARWRRLQDLRRSNGWYRLYRPHGLHGAGPHRRRRGDRPGGNDTNDTTDAGHHNHLHRNNLRDVPGNASGVTERHSSLKNDADLQVVLLRLNVLRSWKNVAGIAGRSGKSGRQPTLGRAFGSRPSVRLCPTRGAASREGEPSAASSRLARRLAPADEIQA